MSHRHLAALVAGLAVGVACGGATTPSPSPSSPRPDISGPAATIDPRPVVSPASVTLRVGETQRFAAHL